LKHWKLIRISQKNLGDLDGLIHPSDRMEYWKPLLVSPVEVANNIIVAGSDGTSSTGLRIY